MRRAKRQRPRFFVTYLNATPLSPGVIQIKARQLALRSQRTNKTRTICLLLVQLKRMQIARFLCNKWEKYIR
jgi:hypothetical protein